jgi:hypothetical protein
MVAFLLAIKEEQGRCRIDSERAVPTLKLTMRPSDVNLVETKALADFRFDRIEIGAELRIF